ncbi:MAG: SulP family inorganic anion transporter [Planctomycetia bacterium]|nr:SulP family inorganic anion transporter [Planctomycetia bacterium]
MKDSETKPGFARHWRDDLLASIVVFLVALPLCMGIAIASGAPVAAGLVTGIIGGLIVGSLAGSPLQVSGPAAGLTVIVYELIAKHGIETLGVVVLFAGLIQLAAGAARLGQWFRAVSPAVIHGMLSGIGVLIFASQFHVMVDDKPRENGVRNVATIPEAIAKGLPLPGFVPPEIRAERKNLLRELGDVHERQFEIAAWVAERVSIAGSEEEHQQQAKSLAELVTAQEEVLKQLHGVEERIEELNEHDPAKANRPDREAALAAAVVATEAALAELKLPHTEKVEVTQRTAVAAIGNVANSLKSHEWAAKVGILTILVIVAWQALARGRLKMVPAPLLAVVAATAVAAWLSLPVLYVEVPERLMDGLHIVNWTSLRDLPVGSLALNALMIAVIASAETLLCASAVDRMHSGPRTKYDQELMAQGIGNVFTGMVGGLPMTGVIVRSAANVQAGGKSRLSTILHGAWLLIFVVALGFLLKLIPTACLAGILVYTGYKLINPKSFITLWKQDRGEAIVYAITVIMVVSTDLLIGVATGIVLAALKLVLTFSNLRAKLQVNAAESRAMLSLAGAATFIRLPVLVDELDRVPAGVELHVDFQRLDFIDHSCLETLMNWAKQHESNGGRLVIDWDSLHARIGRDAAHLAPSMESRPLPRPHVGATKE